MLRTTPGEVYRLHSCQKVFTTKFPRTTTTTETLDDSLFRPWTCTHQAQSLLLEVERK